MSVHTTPVWLDFGPAGSSRKTGELLKNLSAVAWADPWLWTASDEGRTIECFEQAARGFRLHRQIRLDDVFARLPGAADQDEADIESIDVANGHLFVCGSHSMVRLQREKMQTDRVNPELRVRKSRRILGWLPVSVADGEDVRGTALPSSRKGSLRRMLARNAYLSPFIDLPSKENGLDIEGMVVWKRKLLLGLRGPLVDSVAIAVELRLAAGSEAGPELASRLPHLHFLTLDGLGVRDLTRWGDDVLVLAGPVSSASGPFRLYRWRPRATPLIQKPTLLHEWKQDRPEGICRHDDALLVVYDVGDDRKRIKGKRFRADRLSGIPGLR